MALEQSYGGSRASEVTVEDLRSSNTNTDYNRSTYIKLLILPDLCFSDAFKLLTCVISACIALTSWARWLSNHQPYVCLLNRLFRCRSKKNQSSPSLAFLRGFPSQRARNAEKLPFDGVIMWLTFDFWHAIWSDDHIGAPNHKTWIFLVSSCSCLCPIQRSQTLSRKWRRSWRSRRQTILQLYMSDQHFYCLLRCVLN